VKISAELFDLLNTALDYSRVTDGAFDITYASVGYLYNFRKHIHPNEKEIEAALPGVNYRHVVLDPKEHTVRFTQPGVRIDLGGIGKGHSVDRGIALLQGRGIAHALVTAGGDSRIIGDRFGKPWVVGIRHPDRKDEVIARIPLEDAAISTSGDYERYFDEAACAITTSSIRARATPPAKCAARRSSDRRRRVPTACRRPRSYSDPSVRWKSTIASMTSTRSS
jgi:thiamine biosynthesis lipoprotein